MLFLGTHFLRGISWEVVVIVFHPAGTVLGYIFFGKFGQFCRSLLILVFSSYFLGSLSNGGSPIWYCSQVPTFWVVRAILLHSLVLAGFQFILFGQFEQFCCTHLALSGLKYIFFGHFEQLWFSHLVLFSGHLLGGFSPRRAELVYVVTIETAPRG